MNSPGHTYRHTPFPRPLEFFPGKPPSFRDWLEARYGYSPAYFYLLCTQTGRPSDYYRAMDWFRRRYLLETGLRRQVLENIPFD